MMKPMASVRRVRKPRARTFGRYCRVRAASRILSLVSGLANWMGSSRRTRDAVDASTPASFATSLRVVTVAPRAYAFPAPLRNFAAALSYSLDNPLSKYNVWRVGVSLFRSVETAGGIHFVIGMIGREPDGTVVEGITRQTKLTLERIEAELDQKGRDRSAIVRLRFYVVDMRLWPLAREVAKEFFNGSIPPST